MADRSEDTRHGGGALHAVLKWAMYGAVAGAIVGGALGVVSGGTVFLLGELPWTVFTSAVLQGAGLGCLLAGSLGLGLRVVSRLLEPHVQESERWAWVARIGDGPPNLIANVWDLAAPYVVILIGALVTRLCFTYCGDGHCDISEEYCLAPIPVAVIAALALVAVVVFRTVSGRRNSLRLWLMMPLLLIVVWAFTWLQAELAG